MKTVVYPLTVQLDYTELKYSLRSLDKFLPKPFEVVIVGNVIPDWITNVTQIELPDVTGRPMLSVRRKVIAALHYRDEFLFMNDDIYLIDTYKPTYYSSGTLKGKAESGAKQTCDQLAKYEKSTSYYGHYPAEYKNDFIDIVSRFTDDCITKSAYLNCKGVESVEVKDCKIITPLKPKETLSFISNKPCFSTGPRSIDSVLPVLQKLFPNPSIFEI